MSALCSAVQCQVWGRMRLSPIRRKWRLLEGDKARGPGVRKPGHRLFWAVSKNTAHLLASIWKWN